TRCSRSPTGSPSSAAARRSRRCRARAPPRRRSRARWSAATCSCGSTSRRPSPGRRCSRCAPCMSSTTAGSRRCPESPSACTREARWICLYPDRLIERARRLIREFDVRGGGPLTRAGGLSGGNQQKVVVAREISRDPKVLIAAQPTRGLDVGAIEYLHRRLVEERDKGRAILLVSLELEEIFSLSDRILVLYEGEIVGDHTGEVSEEELGLEMLGGKDRAAA